MAVMMPRMISAGSLSAFSTSVAASLPSARSGAVPGLVPVRDPGSAKPEASQPVAGAAPVVPSRKLPRGSLLDLQV